MFINSGKLDIFSNNTKLTLRRISSSENKWFFTDAVKGAPSSIIAYTIIETAKSNGLDPFNYLSKTLLRIQYIGKNISSEELDKLMPWSPVFDKLYIVETSLIFSQISC